MQVWLLPPQETMGGTNGSATNSEVGMRQWASVSGSSGGDSKTTIATMVVVAIIMTLIGLGNEGELFMDNIRGPVDRRLFGRCRRIT